MRAVMIAKSLSAPGNCIVHSLTDTNNQIIRGRPFFTDIVKQGVALYESEGLPFAHPGMLPPAEEREEAQGHFDRWFEGAGRYLETGLSHASKGWKNEAAFELHQSTERFYHCVLLVLTLYSPKSHKLNFLRSRAEEIAPALIPAWPRDDKFSRRCFDLLRQAYINARYSPHYEISGEELAWLGERVTALQALVETVCRERLDSPLTTTPTSDEAASFKAE